MINSQLLRNMPSNDQIGSLLYSLAYRCKQTTPYLQRELHYLRDQGLVQQDCLGMLWKRTISGDQLLEHQLSQSHT